MEVDVPNVAVSKVDRLEPEIHPVCVDEHPLHLLHLRDVKGLQRLRAGLQGPAVGAGSAVAELHVDVLHGRVEGALVQQAVGEVLEMAELGLQVEEEVLEDGQLVELVRGVVEHVLSEPIDADDLVVEDVPVEGAGEVPGVLEGVDVDVVD